MTARVQYAPRFKVIFLAHLPLPFVHPRLCCTASSARNNNIVSSSKNFWQYRPARHLPGRAAACIDLLHNRPSASFSFRSGREAVENTELACTRKRKRRTQSHHYASVSTGSQVHEALKERTGHLATRAPRQRTSGQPERSSLSMPRDCPPIPVPETARRRRTHLRSDAGSFIPRGWQDKPGTTAHLSWRSPRGSCRRAS